MSRQLGADGASWASKRLTSGQIRAARGMLDWGRVDLATAAALSVSSVKRAEDASPEAVSGDIHAAIRRAFEARGVIFLADDGGGPGLRYREVASPVC